MLIVSQDRQYQTENLEMVIAPEVDSEGETGRYEILSHNEYCLGVYEDLEIAKVVMKEIIKELVNDVCVYFMPTNSEIIQELGSEEW